MAKFAVEVCRIAYCYHTIEVEAKTREEAEESALDEAGNYEYSENGADYVVNGITERNEED